MIKCKVAFSCSQTNNLEFPINKRITLIPGAGGEQQLCDSTGNKKIFKTSYPFVTLHNCGSKFE